MSHLLVRGDARRGIPLADGSVHCCISSPPYWGLRDYDVGPDQIGLEPTPEEYVAHLVDVFREVRRVMRDDATMWLNLGDSYSSPSGVGRRDVGREFAGSRTRTIEPGPMVRRPGNAALGPKQLLGIPWRVAFALQADGYYLRSDIIWHKPSPMPESVTDRPTKSHEYLFLLSKAPTYYYDSDAIREPYAMTSWTAAADASGTTKRGQVGIRSGAKGRAQAEGAADGSLYGETSMMQAYAHGGRNRRTVWTIATKPLKMAHFATFPPALVEPCVLAGTSARGCCPACGAPWRRLVEKESVALRPNSSSRRGNDPSSRASTGDSQRGAMSVVVETLGWEPSCSCPPHEPVPCVVFDPFVGAGTVPLVAEALGRRGVGMDVSARYLRLARRRINRPHAPPERPDDGKPLPLFA